LSPKGFWRIKRRVCRHNAADALFVTKLRSVPHHHAPVSVTLGSDTAILTGNLARVSLLSREFAGNFHELGADSAILVSNRRANSFSGLQPNPYTTEQGIFLSEAGNLASQAGNFARNVGISNFEQPQ
jgi:hypothetical protein